MAGSSAGRALPGHSPAAGHSRPDQLRSSPDRCCYSPELPPALKLLVSLS